MGVGPVLVRGLRVGYSLSPDECNLMPEIIFNFPIIILVLQKRRNRLIGPLGPLVPPAIKKSMKGGKKTDNAPPIRFLYNISARVDPDFLPVAQGFPVSMQHACRCPSELHA